MTSTALLTPAMAARVARSTESPDTGELVRTLRSLMSGVIRSGIPVKCGLTAGRDSRVLLALVESLGGHARYYTVGQPGDDDVEIARQIAADAGLEHEVWAPDAAPGSQEWRRWRRAS